MKTKTQIQTIEPQTKTVAGSRRSFLRQSVALTGGALTGNALAQTPADNLPPNIPAWMKREGRALSDGKYGLPSAFEKEVVRRGRGDQVMRLAAQRQARDLRPGCAVDNAVGRILRIEDDDRLSPRGGAQAKGERQTGENRPDFQDKRPTPTAGKKAFSGRPR